MSKLFVDEIVHQSSQGSGTITIGASGENVNLGTGVSGGTLTNIPAFEAYMSADTTISDNTWTKVPFNTEDFDTDNTYDNSTNYRFTPTVAGKYYVYSGIKLGSSVSNKQQSCEVRIYKNGAAWKESQYDPEDQRSTQDSIFIYSTMVLNGSSDYVEIFGKHNVVSSGGAVPRFDAGVGSCWFGAYRLIGT